MSVKRRSTNSAVTGAGGRLSPQDCLMGGGDMGALMRSTDWSRSVFGPVAAWPQSLRTAISIMLESRFAMVVAWGPEFRFFYNDRYRPILGTKHPAALGAPAAEIFPEVWPAIRPAFEGVRRGEAFAIDDWLLPLERNGYLENCWFQHSSFVCRFWRRSGRRRRWMARHEGRPKASSRASPVRGKWLSHTARERGPTAADRKR